METIVVKFKMLDKRAIVPTYAHDGDVCMDFTAISCEYDEENDMYVYHTGWAVESDFGLGQFIFPRSSNRRTDCYLTNSVGVVDSAIYRGEICFCYKNRDSLETKATLHALVNCVRWGASASFVDEHVKQIKKRFIEDAHKLLFAPYKVGDRIGQFVFLQYPKIEIETTDTLSSSDRGEGGFGSTGN